ncbi:MAG: BON domain-containing protein, partial [Pirellulales bacterium]|nr:BON domain-containing protein [Pirellulales bacterium]
MSVSRTTYLLAVALVASLAGAAHAEDLATTVAGKLRDSGALSGYRVNVKGKSGTVWLEGQVADQRQLAAAVGIAEATPGVERVVNRLVIERPAAESQSGGGFSLPRSMWNVAGVERPAARPAPEAQSAATTSPNPLAAFTGLFFAGGSQAPATDSRVQLTQATRPVNRMPRTAAARPMQPQGGRPTAMRTAMNGHPMTLPAPGYDGPLVDGQMVPGTMQYSEGYPGGDYPAGDYAVNG